MHLIKLGAFLICLLWCLPASLVASDERPHLSSDPRVNEARALIETGWFAKALQILRPLAPNHPDRTDVLFLIGLAGLNMAQLSETAESDRADLLDEAVKAFHTILIDQPGLVRVRLELAHAFYLNGDDDLSREHFERVLAGSPPTAMATNVKRFLAAIRARQRWHNYFGMTLAPDSNINTASETNIVYIHGLPFRRDSDARVRSGLGIVLWGGGEYQYPLTRQLRLRTGTDIARREYSGHDFDQTFLSAHTGPNWLVNRVTEISFMGSTRRRWTGGEPYSSEFGTRLESAHRFSARLAGNGRLSWHRRNYDRDKQFDGSHVALSMDILWQATPTVRTDISVGYNGERTQSSVWRNTSRWGRLGVAIALPGGFSVGADGEFIRTTYEGNWAPFTPDGTSRKDRTWILRASVFNRAFTLLGFSPKLVLVYEARESNAQLYDYRRRRAELQFTHQF